MKTKRIDFTQGSNLFFRGEQPVECPHCGAFISPKITNIVRFNYKGSNIINCVTFIGECCQTHFFGLYESSSSLESSLLCLYPNQQSAVLPDAIHKISPRFIELYDQCFAAEQAGHLDLAGSGYRNAIEVLVKDFAITELKKSREEVIKKKLASAIKSYLPSIDLAQSADVVRILGNDYTHYERKYDDVTFKIFKQYIEIFIKSIETTYLINHPVVRTQLITEEAE